ncbi:uncharacterized protein [Spinacia oleracea]|uniref:Uncharacterized protein isoform X2 n=1 Tax=Spinacia oleracea TaxID=3562 RepID=A0ABM3R565_SPIOL|nr:uncharacterized protein LOC110778291 isoform X2 [Spinacia oleracea]
MNLDADKIRLIDFTSEDDFLIDSDFDSTFVDLRLSVTFETQNELLSNPKPVVRQGTKDRVPNLAEKQRGNFLQETENGEKICSSRKSLAWDHAFFTSPGFLDLDELSLVNSGFKNLDVSSSDGIKENVKSKVYQERNLSQKLGVGSAVRQKTQSLMKTKVPSPQKINTGRLETISRSAVAKSQSITTSSKECLKSTGIRGYNKKPPLRAISRNGLGRVVSQQSDSRRSYPVSSSQSMLPSYATNMSVDFSPCKTSVTNLQTARVLKSQDKREFNLKDQRKNHRHNSVTKQSLEQDASRQNNGTTETKRSPFSSKTSSLGMPSQKIGFFDMTSEKNRHDQDGKSNKVQRRTSQPSFKKQTNSLEFEEKENIFHPDDTVIELEPELNKGSSPSPSESAAKGSSNAVQCSSTSKKSLTKAQRPAKQALFRTRTTSLTKVSPLKKSAFF